MIPFVGINYNNRTCKDTPLSYDQACLLISSSQSIEAESSLVFGQDERCVSCPLHLLTSVHNNSNSSLVVTTAAKLVYQATTGNGTVICNCKLAFKEYGVYHLNVPELGTNLDQCCKLTMLEEPDEYLLPLMAGLIIALLFGTSWYMVKAIYRKLVDTQMWISLFGSGTNGAELLGNPPSMNAHVNNVRLRSIDIFRGVIIALMILVNYGGGGYQFLRHATWNGLTVADLVFPHFAFLMGFSLCQSLHSRLRTSMTRMTVFWQICRRSLILIGLGIILSSKNASIDNLRIPGVLQRLGVSYFLVASVECFAINFSNNYTSGASLFRDLHSTWKQWTFTLSLVIIHLALTFGLAPPGCPRGYLGPGGLDLNATLSNCTGGAAGYIDRALFGSSHLHRGGTFKKIYNVKMAFDPEGFLGTLTCCLVVQFGIQAGRIVLSYSHATARLRRWIFWSIATGLAAGGLCLFSENDGPIPVNKNLWSLSYCLAASSIAFLVLAFLYCMVDMHRIWGGRPFYYAGRNALLLYIGHELMKNRFPFEWNMKNPTHSHYFAMNIFAVLLWLTIAIFLHRKRIILTI